MASGLDEHGVRTMLIGLLIGMVLYGGGLAARAALPDPWNITVWFALTLTGLIVVTGWFFATRYRGFRVRWLGRSGGATAPGKRAEGRRVREKRKPKRYQ